MHQGFFLQSNGEQVNEGLGKALSWVGDKVGGLFKFGKGVVDTQLFKKYLKDYNQEIYMAVKDRLRAEVELELAKKAKINTSDIKRRFDNMKKHEDAIDAELDAKLNKLKADNPKWSAHVDMLRATATKQKYVSINNALESLQGDEKYRDADIVLSKIAKVKLANKAIDDEIAAMESKLKDDAGKEGGEKESQAPVKKSPNAVKYISAMRDMKIDVDAEIKNIKKKLEEVHASNDDDGIKKYTNTLKLAEEIKKNGIDKTMEKYSGGSTEQGGKSKSVDFKKGSDF